MILKAAGGQTGGRFAFIDQRVPGDYAAPRHVHHNSSSNAAIAVGARVLPTVLSPNMHTLVYGGWIPALTCTVIALVIIIATRGHLSYKRD